MRYSFWLFIILALGFGYVLLDERGHETDNVFRLPVHVPEARFVPTPRPLDFVSAKRHLFRIHDRGVEFYCGCPYAGKRIRLPNECGLRPYRNSSRAMRIEAEHVVPAAVFGRTLPCWSRGGRKTCTGGSDTFRFFEGDLHNLLPVVGEMNGDRSDLYYGEVIGEPRRYGRCDFEIGPNEDGILVAEPRPEIRGWIARISLYMIDKYRMTGVDYRAYNVLVQWAINYPVRDEERMIHDRIAALQGDVNPYVIGTRRPEFRHKTN